MRRLFSPVAPVAIVAALTCGLVTERARAAHVEDSVGKATPTAADDESRFVPVIAGNLGTVDASRRLGFSLDASIDLLARRTFGAIGIAAGLRPHYERFSLGQSDDLGCHGSSVGPCADGSALHFSQTTANAFSLEIPFIAELRSARKSGFVPFIGAAPWLVYLRATEHAQGHLPRTEAVETSASHTFLTLHAFAGLAVYVTERSSLIARVGYRFAPYEELPGGRATVGGESVSVGYRVEL